MWYYPKCLLIFMYCRKGYYWNTFCQTSYGKSSGKSSSKTDYKKVFFDQNPELKGKVIVHHSVEQQVLKRYSGLFTAEEINVYDMLRGIPKDINSKVHLSIIRIEWNKCIW